MEAHQCRLYYELIVGVVGSRATFPRRSDQIVRLVRKISWQGSKSFQPEPKEVIAGSYRLREHRCVLISLSLAIRRKP